MEGYALSISIVCRTIVSKGTVVLVFRGTLWRHIMISCTFLGQWNEVSAENEYGGTLGVYYRNIFELCVGCVIVCLW